MAHQTGQEEAEFKSLPLCLNADCANNTCQSCFNFTDRSTTALPVPDHHHHAPPETSAAPRAEKRRFLEEDENVVVVAKKRVVNRCSGCKRKVGLTGFRCRCGEMFCSQHRYSDRHDCGYDYKAAGREAIAKENPVVRAAKLVKV